EPARSPGPAPVAAAWQPSPRVDTRMAESPAQRDRSPDEPPPETGSAPIAQGSAGAATPGHRRPQDPPPPAATVLAGLAGAGVDLPAAGSQSAGHSHEPVEIPAAESTPESAEAAPAHTRAARPDEWPDVAVQTAVAQFLDHGDAPPDTPAAPADPHNVRAASPQAPGLAPAAVPPHQNDVAVRQQIVSALRTDGGGMVELRLAPEELGRVTMRLSMADDGLTLSIVAERAETLDLIRRNADQLTRDL